MPLRVLRNELYENGSQIGLFTRSKGGYQRREIGMFLLLLPNNVSEHCAGVLAYVGVTNASDIENRHSTRLEIVTGEHRLGQVSEYQLMALFVGKDQPSEISKSWRRKISA
jgi:hypothetical protein